MPTEKCNFRCVYCYEDFLLGRMSNETVGAISGYISRRWPTLTSLSISWFGGEPLNALGVIEEIMLRAAKERPENAHLSSNMTTNAFRLSRNVFDKLIDLGIDSYEITLDGDPEVHNQRRVLSNGSGTFETIWQNLVSCQKSPHLFGIMLRIHAHADTLDELPSFVERLGRQFGGDQRFSFFLKPIARLGGPNNNSIKILNLDDQAQLADIVAQAQALNLHTIKEDSSYICYAAKPNSVVFRSDGSIAKCTAALNAERNKVGRLKPDGTLALDTSKMSLWTKAVFSEDRATRQCPVGSVMGEII